MNGFLTPRRLWLIGTGLSLLAIHSNVDVPLAPWLFPIFLLRYLRLTPTRAGALRIGGALLLGTALWLLLTSLAFVPTCLLIFTVLAAAKTGAFLLDKLLAPRLGGGLLSTLVFPLATVTAEVLFVTVADFGSFGVLGATQHANLPLIQVSSVTGVYGVTFLVAWFAAVVNRAWDRGFHDVRTPVLTYLAVLGAVLGAGAVQLAAFAPTTATVRVAGFSPSAAARTASSDLLRAAQIEYWRPAAVVAADPVTVRSAFSPVLDEMVARTETEAAAGAKIIVWPETQVKVLERDGDALTARVSEITRRHGTYVDLGFAMYTAQAPHVRNVSSLVTPDGLVAWTYDKTHPTPMEPMAPGTGPVPVIDTPYGRLASVICYDADFPALMRLRADIVLVPADDWSGFEWLHAQKAAFRTVENGYAMVRTSSHGVSTAVDAQGRVRAQDDWFASDTPTMVAQVPLQPQSDTFYRRYGDVFGWLCVAATAALGLRALVSPRSRPRARGSRPAPGSAVPNGSGSRSRAL